MSVYLKNYPTSIITIAIIIYLSFFTPPETNAPDIPYLDKIVHFCMYGGLSTLLWIEYFWHHNEVNWTRLVVGGMICPTLMSGLIEIGQSTLTTTRTGDWMDFVANTLGVLVASLIGYYAWKPLVERYKHKK